MFSLDYSCKLLSKPEETYQQYMCCKPSISMQTTYIVHSKLRSIEITKGYEEGIHPGENLNDQ